MGTYVVTGASRGLGLGFTRQLLAEGHRVVALSRQANPESLCSLGPCSGSLELRVGDVEDEGALSKAAEGLGPVDVLINNAGIMGQRNGSLEELDIESAATVFNTNVLGVARSTRAFLPALRSAKGGAKVVNISSLMGSISDSSGGYDGYRMSKAAVNMLTVNLARALQNDGITVIALHPGWVQTDMGGAGAPLSVEDSIAAMVATLRAKGLEESGGFFDRSGKRLAY